MSGLEQYPSYRYKDGKVEKINSSSSSNEKQLHGEKVGQEENIDEGRRKVMKGIGALGVLAALGLGVRKAKEVEKEEPQPQPQKEPVVNTTVPETAKENTENIFWHESATLHEPLEEDAIAFREVVKWDHGKKIELNANTPDRVESYWRKRYKEDPKLRNSLISGYKEMGAWLPYIEKIFEDEGVPKKYAYLAIAESHFNIKKPSPAGAVGHYQIMPRTALGKVARLRINRGFDERKDPLKGAAACARLLKHDFNLIGDWDLTISCYNGSFAWNYIKIAKKSGVKPTYAGFIEYIEQDINGTIDKLNSGLEYTVRKKDSLRLIALRFNHQGHKVTVDDIAERNELGRQVVITEGQKLFIPLSEKEKENKFNKKVRGYIENLNYPPKFKAINYLIETGFVTDKKNELKFRSYLVRQVQEKEQPKKKWLKRLSQKPKTLKTIAKEIGQPVEVLTYLNPAFDKKAPIPDGYTIRIAFV